MTRSRRDHHEGSNDELVNSLLKRATCLTIQTGPLSERTMFWAEKAAICCYRVAAAPLPASDDLSWVMRLMAPGPCL